MLLSDSELNPFGGFVLCVRKQNGNELPSPTKFSLQIVWTLSATGSDMNLCFVVGKFLFKENNFQVLIYDVVTSSVVEPVQSWPAPAKQMFNTNSNYKHSYKNCRNTAPPKSYSISPQPEPVHFNRLGLRAPQLWSRECQFIRDLALFSFVLKVLRNRLDCKQLRDKIKYRYLAPGLGQKVVITC